MMGQTVKLVYSFPHILPRKGALKRSLPNTIPFSLWSGFTLLSFTLGWVEQDWSLYPGLCH